jgi:hypothetical protein
VSSPENEGSGRNSPPHRQPSIGRREGFIVFRILLESLSGCKRTASTRRNGRQRPRESRSIDAEVRFGETSPGQTIHGKGDAQSRVREMSPTSSPG